jgi:non-ribosomal peptide synthetase component F
MRETVLDGIEHQEFPFEKVVEDLRTGRDASRHPLFQVMFQYGRRPSLPRFDDAQVEMIEVRTPTAKFELTLSLVEDAAGLVATVEYNTDLFEHETVERLLVHIETLGGFRAP